MNWDAIGAIAELLGAVGVIASLVYLATQLRQNTRATRASAYQQWDDSLQSTLMEGVTIPALDCVAPGHGKLRSPRRRKGRCVPI